MSDRYQTGEQLLAAFNLPTREARLEQAVKALMQACEELHKYTHNQSLADNLTTTYVTCSCADAYHMGHAALGGLED